jgi:hypothetical protein
LKPELPSAGRDFEPGLVTWARNNVDRALLMCWIAAGVLFLLPIGLLRHSLLLGVLLGFGLLRLCLLAAERLADAVYLDNIFVGDFEEARRAPGLSQARQVQALQRIVTNRSGPEKADLAAGFIAYCLDEGSLPVEPAARAFEATWGLHPSAGHDSGLVRRLVEQGFHFTTGVSPLLEAGITLDEGIPWRTLWRERCWHKLRDEHPHEPIRRLLLRLYASEWQGVLAPAWTVVTLIVAIVLSRPWISTEARGIVFYVSGLVLVPAAFWLAFMLRPAAFNDSLLVGDTDRCARWVLESVEGRHFLVSALGSANSLLRSRAADLVAWHDALIGAGVTLPEGMRAFVHREGSSRGKRQRTQSDHRC